MTKFLASVTGPEEAEVVLEGGADIIDLKEPRDGALGAVSVETVSRTVAHVAGRRLVSAVCGNLPMQPEMVSRAAGALAETGIDYLKIGIFPDGDAAGSIRALAPICERVKLVAVMFADLEPDLDLLPLLADCGFHAVMLDTADKGGGRLLDHLPPEKLQGVVEPSRALALAVGFAGSLEAPDIPRLLSLKPDFLGFRGALCAASRRTDCLDEEAVKLVRSLIPEENPRAGMTRVDYRLLAARGYTPDARDLGTDKIFVRELVLPVEIGAYNHEHGHSQNVRFDVTAEVRRITEDPRDMRHVVSYDIIMDGIRTIVARGHVELAETLAEQVADHVLADPRVVRVSVRVEKLDLGPGSVGVEIERKPSDRLSAQKPAEPSAGQATRRGATS